MKRKFLLLVAQLCTLMCAAHNTLNIHQKDGVLIRYGFAEKPVVSYIDSNLHVSTDNVSIDYPLASLEKLTFTEDESSIGVLKLENNVSEIYIYRTDGTLVTQIMKEVGMAASIDFSALPTGIYIIKQGTVTTKIIVR